MAEMQKRGLTVVQPLYEGADWKGVADGFAAQMRAEAIPEEIFARVEHLRFRYRQLHGSAGVATTDARSARR